VFVVESTETLTPHLVRVHLGGPDFDGFIASAAPERLAATDKYVKLLFARPELGLTPPYDLDALREVLPREDLPQRRTYTVRSVDHDSRTIAIDFVVHGDEGVAGPWARAARPGDVVALSGPGGAYSPAPGDVQHLLLGDDSAIPAIAAALEAMPDDAEGIAIVEVGGSADELSLTAPAGVDIRWLHRESDSGSVALAGEPLTEAVRALARPGGPLDVFAHGERSAMQAIRGILQDEWGLERRAMSLSAYWALGRAEDAFQAEKREPIGRIFAE
jgi:NADPH-dependent ferric siderophore reductase